MYVHICSAPGVSTCVHMCMSTVYMHMSKLVIASFNVCFDHWSQLVRAIMHVGKPGFNDPTHTDFYSAAICIIGESIVDGSVIPTRVITCFQSLYPQFVSLVILCVRQDAFAASLLTHCSLFGSCITIHPILAAGYTPLLMVDGGS